MKKLIYIANIRLPTEKAHGVQIMKMCEAFADEGMDIELVVSSRKTPINENPFDYYNVRKNFTIRKLLCIDAIRFGRIGFLIQSSTFAMSVLWYSMFQNSIFYTRDELVALCLRLIGKNVSWEAHTGQWNIFARFFARTHSAKIVTISDGLKQFYEKKGVLGEKIIVAHDAVDLEQFKISSTQKDARDHLDIKTDLPVIMYIGKLDGWKGVDTLLEASILLKGIAEVFIIGGPETLIPAFKEKYPARFLGFKPYRDLPLNQRAADILVVPNTAKDTISISYTSPLKVFAHMTSGVPIVLSDLPSLREMLDDTSAYFFTADDPKSLADVIRRVLSNNVEAKNKAKKALELVQNYSWQRRADNILEFIDKKI